MNSADKTFRGKIPYLLTGCFSAVLFYIFYGFKVLDPLYVDWLLTGGDPSQHYLGWALFRNTPFRLNFGLTNAAAYPYSTSVIFTDSIPIMAIPCKLIGRFTLAQFQYFGIWALSCVILMGMLSCFLLHRYITESAVLTLSSMLITVSPCMFRRFFWHTSLGAHFLVIFGLILIAYRDKMCDTIRHTFFWWAFLGFMCSFTHIYFLAMNTVLLFVFICFSIIDRKRDHSGSKDRKGILLCIMAALSYIASAALSLWLLGGFSSGMASGAPGVDYYSFNLNGFINPQGWSSLLPDLPRYTPGQYEGFAYLGLGMIVVSVFSAFATLIRYAVSDTHKLKKQDSSPDTRPYRNISYLICGLFFFLITVAISASNEISLNNSLLISFRLPDALMELWSIFRACGRLVWPAVYVICIISLITLSRSLKPAFTAVILTFCIIVQLIDLKDMIREKHSEFDRRVSYENRLKGKAIDDFLWDRNLKHIVFLDKDNLSQEELYAFAEFAARRRLTINDFYFARALKHPVDEVALDFFMHPSQDTLYVISDESYEMRYMFDLEYYKYGDLSLGLKPPQ